MSRAGVISLQSKKNDTKALLLYFKEKKYQQLDIIERELKKLMIVEFQESNCKMMKTIKKINEKKVLKNKAPTKSSEVVKTRK